MRRKSTRNSQKSTPEKPVKDAEPSKTRRSKRRKRTPSKSSDSEEEIVQNVETPDTTTKSHSPSDEEGSEEPVWKVTSTEDAPRGEIQKLKICLTRPSPDSPEKGKSRRSKSNSQTEDDATTSSEDKSSSTTRRTRNSRGSPVVNQEPDVEEATEEKRGKGKSKGKHKSKIEKSTHLSEPEIVVTQTNNEISENVQVTPQSPTIDKPVVNENDDDDKVDDVRMQNVNESCLKQGNDGEEAATLKECVKRDDDESNDVQSKDSDDDRPLSSIQKQVSEEKSEIVAENVNQQQVTIETITTTAEVTENVASEQKEEMKIDSTSDQVQIEEGETVEVLSEKVQEEILEVESQVSISEDASIQGVEETSVEEVEVDQAKKVNETESQEVSAPVENSEKKVDVAEDRPETKVPERKPRRRLRRDFDPARFQTAPAAADSAEKKEETPGDEETTVVSEITAGGAGIKPSRIKRKWEGATSDSPTLVKVDLECIQAVCPDIDFPEEPDLSLDHAEKERRRSTTAAELSAKRTNERKVSIEYGSESSEKPPYEKQTSVGSATQESEDNSNIIAFNRKISIVDDTASKLKPPPSPAKNPLTNILYITNLVRPFTLKQLRELLERTGKIREEGFWTDRIKSKCYVQYETEEEAEATRNALHGVQWPIGNGKKLIIDYAIEEDFKNAKNPPPPPVVAPVQEVKVSVKENVEPVESKSRNEERSAKEVEKKRPEGHVREWDIGKKDFRRDRSRSRERSRKHRRSPSPPEDFISRKHRKAEESIPQKLMDDLFLKTKATPSIYWQPLSPEEISMKQQQRLIRMEEHKRRMEENSRMRGREMGRGGFRRRYD